jgi:anti-sigma factor RsiW
MNELTCADVTDLAGLYALDALEPAERARVEAHLATCPQAHAEFAAVGGVAPALASLADPVDAPSSLKDKVMADYRAGAAAGVAAPVVVRRAPTPVIPLRPARPSWLGWAAAAAAVLLIAVLGGWGYVNQSRADAEGHRAQVLAQAIDIMSAPGSSIALMRGTASAAGASGFAALSANGTGYLVLTDLPAAPAGQTYQAWYISIGGPSSAGLVSVDRDGFAVMALPFQNGADLVALTLEPAGGSPQPTSDPIVAGELHGPVVTAQALSIASR